MQGTAPATDDVIARALLTAREMTGMDLAFIGEFREGQELIRRIDGDPATFGLTIDDGPMLVDTYCQRMVDGRLSCAVPDSRSHPETAGLEATEKIGAYVGVPLRLPDGRLYGTFCALASDARPTLGEAEAQMMHMLATLVGMHIGEVEANRAAEVAQHEFIASVSHDLRSPLTAIRGWAGVLLEPDLEPGDLLRARDAIVRNSDKLDRMVGDLLLLAQMQAGGLTLEREPVDLAALAAEAAADFDARARETDVRVDVACDADLVATVDRLRLGQLLDNLLSNAIKYSPDGGTVRLAVRCDGPLAVLEIADEGIGIDPADQERLFDRFFRAGTAKRHGIAGIGLGLSICQAIAGAHEGTIEVASEPGSGTCFTVRLPLRWRDAIS